MALLLGRLSGADLTVLFVVLALVAVCVALWRAVERDILGVILSLAVALICIIIAYA
jgi:hypothetical protein